MSKLFSFPNPVNEVSARLVAAGVVVMGVTAIVFRLEWLVLVIGYGFGARVLAGPRFSPLGQLVTRVVTPRLPFAVKPVAGPPKRFAQFVGLLFSGVSAVLLFVVQAQTAGWIVLGLLVGAATLEAVFAFCLGCRAFAVMMRVGIIPEEVCEACSNIQNRDVSRR